MEIKSTSLCNFASQVASQARLHTLKGDIVHVHAQGKCDREEMKKKERVYLTNHCKDVDYCEDLSHFHQELMLGVILSLELLSKALILDLIALEAAFADSEMKTQTVAQANWLQRLTVHQLALYEDQ